VSNVEVAIIYHGEIEVFADIASEDESRAKRIDVCEVLPAIYKAGGSGVRNTPVEIDIAFEKIKRQSIGTERLHGPISIEVDGSRELDAFIQKYIPDK
jgi:hypothetical protein